MIAKKDLQEGWYKGICRNSHMAYWDSKKQKFIYMRYKFGFFIDTIEHFKDVKDSGFDGFIPVERIEALPEMEEARIMGEVGY